MSTDSGEESSRGASPTSDGEVAPLNSLDLATSTGGFSAATTSSKPVHEIVSELRKAMVMELVTFTMSGPHKMICESRTGRFSRGNRRLSLGEDATIVWEIEIVLIPALGKGREKGRDD